MIEAARRARRPDRQSRDARFAQAKRALPARNFNRSAVVPSERATGPAETRAHWKQQRVGLSALSVRTARTFL